MSTTFRLDNQQLCLSNPAEILSSGIVLAGLGPNTVTSYIEDDNPL